MTRRIVTALLALTIVILAAAVVPLGFAAIAHAKDSFVYSTARTASSVAELAEARLTDNAPDPELSAAMLAAAREHDELLLLDKQGRIVVEQGVPRSGDWRALVAQATQQNGPSTELTSNRAIAVQSVYGDGAQSGSVIGTVVLERPTWSLDRNIDNLWLYLVGLAGAALAAAVGIAIYLARWVGKPLARLDAAARKIADGDLTVRAKTRYGPPELRRMAATFNMMAGRLEALVHGHRAMLADASHQLRTPLTALRLRLDLLAADSPPATAGELAGAQEEIARLSRLVDGLLATARAEAANEQPELTDVSAVITERVAAWQPVADGHAVKLLAEPAASAAGPQVSLGAGHLEQILDNLIDNAIEAIGGDGGTVRVAAAKTGTLTRLTVADDGPGMTPQERSRAFLRFSTGSDNGTGLGLAIVHRLVISNGGTIRLADTPGGGLTVEIELPSQGEP
ncbi:MAG TPA: HAMP domain-containing sensor histidine kinase [Trebonia sp.]|nr:HAMP domain-containing sensor histidine kinase [Trebonia sp.]